MQEYDIPAYLEGRLEGDELEAFEQELRNNPSFAGEVRLAQNLAEDLEAQALRRKVRETLAKPAPAPGPNLLFRWLLALAILAALFLALYFLLPDGKQEPSRRQSTEKSSSSEQPAGGSATRTEPTEPKMEMKEIPEEEAEPLELPQARAEQPEEERPELLAEAERSAPLPDPQFPSPQLRGEESEENKQWQSFLDRIWHTSYPPEGLSFSRPPFEKADALLKERNFSKAYVRLQMLERKLPANDTLSYLKGYCLLELGQGDGALRYFRELKESKPEWKSFLDWHHSLALLQSGAREEAYKEFEAIAKQPQHPFREQAQKALDLMK